MKRKFILLPITLTALAPTISMVGCGDPNIIIIDLNNDVSYSNPRSISSYFMIDATKIYRFNIKSNICETATDWFDSDGTFFILNFKDFSFAHAHISNFTVRTEMFSFLEFGSGEFEEGEYTWHDDLGWIYKDFSVLDKSFTMSITLQFSDYYDGYPAIACWISGT